MRSVRLQTAWVPSSAITSICPSSTASLAMARQRSPTGLEPDCGLSKPGASSSISCSHWWCLLPSVQRFTSSCWLKEPLMNFIDAHLLSLILFVPAIAAVIMLFLPDAENKLIRWVALGASLIPFVLSLVAWFRFDPNQPGFQFEEAYIWYEA